jgi:cytochrome c oxidase subunit 2
MFSGPSKFATEVDSIMLFITASSVLLLLLITIAMIYFIFKYSRKKNPVVKNIEGNTLLEILWIVIPTVLVLFMFYYGFVSFSEARVIPSDAYNVKVIARMWNWSFSYSNGKKSDTLFLALNKPVKLDLITTDVNHSLYVPAFRIKEDVTAGRQNFMVLRPTKIGSFDILCSEYCGVDHSKMLAKLVVKEENDFNLWLNMGSVPIESNKNPNPVMEKK